MIRLIFLFVFYFLFPFEIKEKFILPSYVNRSNDVTRRKCCVKSVVIRQLVLIMVERVVCHVKLFFVVLLDVKEL